MENRKEKKTEITKYNATKHGILRESVTSYETSDYEAFYNELEADIKPINSLERLLLERIVINKIKLDRVSKAESEIIKQSLDPRKVRSHMDMDWGDILENEGYTPKLSPDFMNKLEVYSRYETQAENRMYKAIRVLQGMRSV